MATVSTNSFVQSVVIKPYCAWSRFVNISSADAWPRLRGYAVLQTVSRLQWQFWDLTPPTLYWVCDISDIHLSWCRSRRHACLRRLVVWTIKLVDKIRKWFMLACFLMVSWTESFSLWLLRCHVKRWQNSHTSLTHLYWYTTTISRRLYKEHERLSTSAKLCLYHHLDNTIRSTNNVCCSCSVPMTALIQMMRLSCDIF